MNIDALFRPTTLGLTIAIGACFSPAPHVIVTVEDPSALATDAVTLAYGGELGELKTLELDGKALPASLALTSDEEETALFWFEALDAEVNTLARGRARLAFKRDSTTSVTVTLVYACRAEVDVVGGCALEDASGNDGICRGVQCIVSTCGDGVVDTERGELCDDGDLNSDSEPNRCRIACRPPSCGDNVTDDGEGCDDGNNILEACAYGDTACRVCNESCVEVDGAVSFCGDAVADTVQGETCDDDNALTDPCAYGETSCEVCTESCLLGPGVTSWCGDGLIDGEGREQCDDGAASNDDAWALDAHCKSDCSGGALYCGDGSIQTAFESCDDGDGSNFDAWAPTRHCRAECDGWAPYCGDGAVDAGDEGCDNGAANSDTDADACREDCTPARCGDGVVDGGEACDDGGESTACNDDCTLPACGDGKINVSAGEGCDDGFTDACGSCNVDCSGAGSASVCGDGLLCPEFEVCDDSGASAQCSIDCRARVQIAASEHAVCGVRSDGSLRCWGSGGATVGVPPGPFIAVSVGRDFACALRPDHTPQCWGVDTLGQSSPLSYNFVTLTSGTFHTCGITTSGETHCWGAVRTSSLDEACQGIECFPDCCDMECIDMTCELCMPDGIADEGCVCEGGACFQEIVPIPGAAYSAVAAGGRHTCAITTATSGAECWGITSPLFAPATYYFGQSEPPAGAYKAISAGAFHTCAIASDDTLACWGANLYGQGVPLTGTYTELSAGAQFNCAIASDGTLACWGLDSSGQTGPPPGSFTQVSAGDTFACAVRDDDAVLCWGSGAAATVPADFP